MDWINNIDWAQVGLIVMAVDSVLQRGARMTKTKKDDKIISKLGKVLNFLFSATRTK